MDTKHKHDSSGHHGEVFDLEIDTPAIIRFTVGLLVVTVIIYIVVYGMQIFFEKLEASSNPPPHPMATQRKMEPPLPKLQPDPMQELADYNANQQAALKGGSTPNGKAIAVEDGMKQVLQKGLPVRTGADNLPYKDLAEKMPSAASSGRLMEHRLR